VDVLDALSLVLITSISVGRRPNGLAYNPATGYLYVAHRDHGTVAVIDSRSNSTIATVPVGYLPNGVAVNPLTNKVYVANYGSNSITVINGHTHTTHLVSGYAGREPSHLVVHPGLNLIFVSDHASSTVSVIRGNDDTVIRTIMLPDLIDPYGIAIDSIRNRVYAAGISSRQMAILDATTGDIVAIIGPLGAPTWMAVANPDTGHVFVTGSLGPDTPGHVYVYDAYTQGWLSPPLPVGSQPEQGIALDSTTGRIFISNSGSNSITVLQDCR
jgi:YVTN family beta-propeller protein